MKRLASDSFQAARAYLFSSGRPVDQALFRSQFEGGAAEGVSDALRAYANLDGGFGRALEPDFRVQASSALATSVALQKVRLGGVGARGDLFGNAICYLLDTVERHEASGGMGWPIIPDAARSSETLSAPWWSRTLGERERSDLLNPSAELLGYLIEAQHAGYEDVRLDEVIAGVTRLVLQDLAGREGVLDGHDLLCLMRLVKTPGLPADLERVVTARLRADAPQAVLTDPAEWGGYGLMPLWLVPEPDEAMIAVLGQALIDAHLDYEIDRQQADGGWGPFWDWGPDGGEAWGQARVEWVSELTLQTLMFLHVYDRL